MNVTDESAYERQHGPLPVQDKIRVLRGILEPDWIEAHEEYKRLRDSGLPPASAVQIFRPLLRDPALRDAAQFMLDTWGG